jgi:hypothetical protein
MAAELDRDLEDREPVRPRREAAGAAVSVELSDDGDDRVIGGLRQMSSSSAPSISG